MVDSPELHPLVELDELERVEGLPVPSFAHRDHRWALPLIRWAQLGGHVPTPTKLVLFDAHHDALPPRNSNWLGRDYDTSIAGLIDLCANHLSTLDDDWITAGMEVGLISDAVVLGVHDRYSAESYETYDASDGTSHRFHFMGLPAGELAYQGNLSDVARRHALSELWRLLEWDPGRPDPYKFGPGRERFVLDFDLDCFAVDWHEYTFSWPEEVWEKEFDEHSHYRTTMGISGASWTSSLLNAAGMVTFCTEPDCCGGGAKAEVNWHRLNEHLFNGYLHRVPMTTAPVP